MSSSCAPSNCAFPEVALLYCRFVSDISLMKSSARSRLRNALSIICLSGAVNFSYPAIPAAVRRADTPAIFRALRMYSVLISAGDYVWRCFKMRQRLYTPRVRGIARRRVLHMRDVVRRMNRVRGRSTGLLNRASHVRQQNVLCRLVILVE